MAQEQSQSQDAPRLLVLELVEKISQQLDRMETQLRAIETMVQQLVQASGAAPPSGGLGH